MNLSYAVIAISTTLLPLSADAASMLCVNSGKTFRLSFDQASESMKSTVPGSDFKVASIAGPMVSGTTTEDGPSFRALFEGQKRLEYYHHGKLMQTLLCH